MTRLESRPGTYALILACTTEHPVQVGKRGRLIVRPGFYVYVRSAFGPGGLGARVARHCREEKRLRWHIDYLRAAAAPDEVWYTLDPAPGECRWAEAFRQMPRSSMPMDGFGASDCSCRSHLLYFRTRPSRRRFRRLLWTVVGRRVPVSGVSLCGQPALSPYTKTRSAPSPNGRRASVPVNCHSHRRTEPCEPCNT